MPTSEALNVAREYGVDLVEVAPNAKPPVCRLVDYGKYCYEQSKKEKEQKKHQHSNKVKEVQLRPAIDPHDFQVKATHAIEFLCEDMKVKVSLRFRGREMAHKEIGFDVVKKFIDEMSPYGQADAKPRLIGRNINVMISPLPKNKRANPPHKEEEEPPESNHQPENQSQEKAPQEDTDFNNNPFQNIQVAPENRPPDA